jgi:putative alpha-1,2-mannosidase
VSPSGGIYVFGSPRFNKVSLDLPNGRKFIIEARNNSAENIYIQAVKLNGKSYDRSYLTHNDLIAGGKLVFIMGPKPNRKFGSSSEARPKSIM